MAGRARAVRVLGLPFVTELGHRSILALRDEGRVEAESFAPPRLVGDAAFEDPGSAMLLAVRPQRHELADVAGSATVAGDPGELLQQPFDVLVARKAGRVNPWGAAEAVDLEA
jgi:hypothetical protein